MVCPHCRTETPLTTGRCIACSAELSAAIGGLMTGAITPAPNPALDVTRIGSGASSGLGPGVLFAGRYRIERLLGVGGMGAVYKAQDQELGIAIALKVIRTEVLSNPSVGIDFERRFKQELLLARQVTHQNVLRIHDLGEANGVKYITMPFIEGSDLHSILISGRVPFEKVLVMARQMTSGLAAAHEVGIVHRDLKPQNILVDLTGRTYISDFGLAKSYEASAAGLTRPGDFIGTPRYMAPESVEGQPTDHRSDLYALGLILYEMASGSTPFPGESALEVLMQRVRISPRPLKEVAPELPPFFSNIVMRCLEKNPNHRYQHAREILQDLEQSKAPSGTRIRSGHQSVVINVPLPSSRRGWTVAALITVMLAGGLLAIPPVRHLFYRSSSTTLPSPSERKLIAVLPFQAAGAQSLDHIATGVAEAMSAKLFGLSQVTVAPTSAIEGVDLKQSHAKLARELGSNLLVTGTVQGNDAQIAIIIKVEDPIAPRTIWTKEYKGSLNDLLTMQEQMFTGLVDALNVSATSAELAKSSTRPTQNIAAYDSYLKGRNALRGQQDRRNVQAALDFFNDALKQDPRFALAFAGLSDASVAMYHDTADTKWADQAVFTAQQAKRLDDSLLEVRNAMGQAYIATGRANEAISELRRALEIAPNSDEAYRRLAAAYRIAGQPDEAIKMHKLAIEKNPYYWINYNSLGYTYWRLANYEDASAEFKKVIEIEPENVNGYNDLGAVYLQTGRYQDAADALQKALKVGNTPDTWSNLGVAYAWMGRFPEALPYLSEGRRNQSGLGWMAVESGGRLPLAE